MVNNLINNCNGRNIVDKNILGKLRLLIVSLFFKSMKFPD